MTMTDPTLQARVEAIEALLGVDAFASGTLVPPITIGELTNVPTPGSQLSATWAQDVSSRIVHRYPNKAALDGWTTALTGTHAITLDTMVLYRRVTGGWSQVTPWATSAAGIAVGQAAANGTYTLATVNIPADPSPNRVAYISCFVRVYKFGPSDQTVYVTHNGVNVLEHYLQMTSDYSYISAGTLLPNHVAMGGVFSIPANTVVPVTVKFVKGGDLAARVDAAANYNRLDVFVSPRG